MTKENESKVITIVTENDEIICYKDKLESHNENTELHRGISVFLVTPNGEMLIQKRSSLKQAWPNYWSNAVCGHPQENETYLQVSLRHLKHELNLHDIDLIQMGQYRYSVTLNGVKENEICHVFVGLIDSSKCDIINFNPNEIEELGLVKLNEFNSLISEISSVSFNSKNGTIKVDLCINIPLSVLKNNIYISCKSHNLTNQCASNKEAIIAEKLNINLEKSQITPWFEMGFYVSKLCFYRHINKIKLPDETINVDKKPIMPKILSIINAVIDHFSDHYFVYDSREASHDKVFIPLRGQIDDLQSVDGHKYTLEALKKGVRYMILDHLPLDAEKYLNESSETQITIIYVKDTYEFMIEFARYKRFIKNHQTFVGITGSVGKTSLKRFFSDCLLASTNIKNQNNHIGVPINLINLPNNQLNALEMGMNHYGEIKFLSSILRPNYAIVTPITEAHIEHFNSISNIAKAKAEIFEYKPKVTILSNCSSYNLMISYAKKFDVNVFGVSGIKSYKDNKENNVSLHNHERKLKKESFDCKLEEFEMFYSGDQYSQLTNDCVNKIKIRVKLSIFDKTYSIVCQYMPKHVFETLMCGILFYAVFYGPQDLTNERIEFLISKYSLENGRGNVLYQESFFGTRCVIFNDSYNANPTSMNSALENFVQFAKILDNINKPTSTSLSAERELNRVVILGDMLELGSFTEKFHLSILDGLETKFDLIILCGTFIKCLYYHLLKASIKANLLYFSNCEDLVNYLKLNNVFKKENLILIKGSNAIGLHKLCNIT